MLKFTKAIIWLVAVLAFVIFGFTVKLGNYTLFGHMRRIWKTEETQDFVKGTRDKADPMLDRVERGVKKGVKEAKDPKKQPQKKP